jgi:hypothetical protein
VRVGVVGERGEGDVFVLAGKVKGLLEVKGVLEVEVGALKVMGDWWLFVWRVIGSLWMLKGWKEVVMGEESRNAFVLFALVVFAFSSMALGLGAPLRVGDIVHGGVEMFVLRWPRGDGRAGV